MSKTAAQAGLRVAAGLALIFDLDGVIVDSMPVHELAWRRYLESLGFDGGDIPARMHGRRNDEIVRDFLGEAIDHNTVLAHGAAKERVFRDMLRERLRNVSRPKSKPSGPAGLLPDKSAH